MLFFLSFLGWFAERKFFKKNTIGIADDYIATTSSAKSGDIIYLDPPYFHTKGRYFGTINFERFLNYLEDLNKRIQELEDQLKNKGKFKLSVALKNFVIKVKSLFMGKKTHSDDAERF